MGGVSRQPTRYVVVVELLAPEHPGEGLAHHHRLVGRRCLRGQLAIELVGLFPAVGYDLVEGTAQRGRSLGSTTEGAQPQPQLDGRA